MRVVVKRSTSRGCRHACVAFSVLALSPLTDAVGYARSLAAQPIAAEQGVTASMSPLQRPALRLHTRSLTVNASERPLPQLPTTDSLRAPWYAPVLSAVLPGAGQGVLRQQRGALYLAVEGYLVIRALAVQRDADREATAYRELARTVSRAPFGGERPDGNWAYYERLQTVLESGAFNATPSAGFTPESDPATFNGSIWLLARETFWRDPGVAPDPSSSEYRNALAFYQQRAAGEAFRWSWRDAQLEQDVYRQTINRRNEASRRARQLVGLVLANHALSMVDAYIAVRLRLFATPPADGMMQLGLAGSVPLPGRGR